MTENTIWPLYDIILVVVGIFVVIGILVLDIIFCNYFKGFCALRWTLNFFGTAVYNSTSNPFAKLFILGIIRSIDLIPL